MRQSIMLYESIRVARFAAQHFSYSDRAIRAASRETQVMAHRHQSSFLALQHGLERLPLFTGW